MRGRVDRFASSLWCCDELENSERYTTVISQPKQCMDNDGTKEMTNPAHSTPHVISLVWPHGTKRGDATLPTPPHTPSLWLRRSVLDRKSYVAMVRAAAARRQGLGLPLDATEMQCRQKLGLPANASEADCQVCPGVYFPGAAEEELFSWFDHMISEWSIL